MAVFGYLKNIIMKTGNTKSWSRELGYIALIILASVVLSVTIFPLFMSSSMLQSLSDASLSCTLII